MTRARTARRGARAHVPITTSRARAIEICLIVISPPDVELEPEGTAHRIRAELALDLHRARGRRRAEVGVFGIRSAELRPRFQVAAREAELRMVRVLEKAGHEAARNIVVERQLAELPERR